MFSHMRIALNDAYRFALCKIKALLFWNHYFAALREPKIDSVVQNDPQAWNEVISGLRSNGFSVIDLYVDMDDYKRYLERAEYTVFRGYYFKFTRIAKSFAEKSLGHYLAARLLNLSNNDICVDVASSNSPTPEIYQKLYGCQSYRQDMIAHAKNASYMKRS